MRRLLFALLLGPGCLSPLGGGGPTSGGDDLGTGATATTTGTMPASTTAVPPGPGTTTSTGPDVTGADDTTSMSFIPASDMGQDLGLACDIFVQDCPAGQKCAWSSVEFDYPDSTHCVPLADDPRAEGAACSYDVDNPYNGIDDCGPVAVCLEAAYSQDPWDGQGVCKSLCLGSWEHPYCPTGSTCVGGRALWVCEDICDPIAQDCPDGTRCDLFGSAPLCGQTSDDAPNLGAGAECSWLQDCAPGLTCRSDAAPGCETECCTPFCDRSDPQASCPLPGQACRGLWDDSVTPGAETLGVCRQEAP